MSGDQLDPDDWVRIDFLDDPVEGACTACGRLTWDAANIGHQCLMTQPDRSRCPGVFEVLDGETGT